MSQISGALGYQRLGSRIRAVLDADLRTAVRRGIVRNERGELSILCRSIEQYDRDFLKEQFLASLGKSWWERGEAIRNGARYLGFRRTGTVITETFQSLINGLIRQRRLERDGPYIRRT